MISPVCILISSFLYFVSGTDPSLDIVFQERISIGSCRSDCLARYPDRGSDWLLCWDVCELMPSHTEESLCSRNNICFGGCQAACQFYQREHKGSDSSGVNM